MAASELLSRFGEQAIRRDVPMAQMEEVLVPLYLHHRYQVEATASALGGLHYIYAMRGDGRDPVKPVPPKLQLTGWPATGSHAPSKPTTPWKSGHWITTVPGLPKYAAVACTESSLLSCVATKS